MEKSVNPQSVHVPLVNAVPIEEYYGNYTNYLRANYEMDRITQEFTNCFSQIIDDAVKNITNNNVGFDYKNEQYETNPIPEPFKKLLFGDEDQISQQKMLVLFRHVGETDRLLLKHKFLMGYSNELIKSLDILNKINQNLKDADFINSLYQPATTPFNETVGISFTGLTNQKIHIAITKLLASSINKVYHASLYPWDNNSVNRFLFDLLDPFIYTFINYISTIQNGNNPYFLHLVPLTTTYINNVAIIRPDFRFFIRYFDCFVNFVTQLVAINFDVAQQLGGNRRKTRRKRGSKRVRKSKRYRK